MIISMQDKEILQKLGEEYIKLADDPINKTRRKNHKKINNLEKAKPTISIYQIPWHEMNVNDELTIKTKDPFCQKIEQELRRKIYQFKHMPGDMVLEKVMVQSYCIEDSGYGIKEVSDVKKLDNETTAPSRHFHIQIKDEGDIEKIQMPIVTFDKEKTENEYQAKCEIFDGILKVEKRGCTGFWFAPWDELVCFTGVQEILMDMALRPEYVNKLMERIVDAWLYRLDQYKKQNLLYKEPLDMWGVGAAQVFSEVSPQMHEEYALRHESRWFANFGENYYGCCEPLHNKVDIAKRNIPRLKKISMSPWVDFDKAVKNVGDSLIFAWKPNPSHLAGSSYDPQFIRSFLEEKIEKSKDCIVEIHLKDISTVSNQPQRLWEWAKIAKEVTEKYSV